MQFCPYHKKETTEDFVEAMKSCLEPCPFDGESCYRWDICFLGREYDKSKSKIVVKVAEQDD